MTTAERVSWIDARVTKLGITGDVLGDRQDRLCH
jgi:hypothetical protein